MAQAPFDVDRIYDEWKYRHELFFTSLFRYAAAYVALTAAPHFRADAANELGAAVWALPLISAAFGAFAFLQLWAEHARLIWLRRQCDPMGWERQEREAALASVGENFWTKPLRRRMGGFILASFGVGMLALLGLNVVMLWIRSP